MILYLLSKIKVFKIYWDRLLTYIFPRCGSFNVSLIGQCCLALNSSARNFPPNDTIIKKFTRPCLVTFESFQPISLVPILSWWLIVRLFYICFFTSSFKFLQFPFPWKFTSIFCESMLFMRLLIIRFHNYQCSFSAQHD